MRRHLHVVANSRLSITQKCEAISNGNGKFEVKHYDHRFKVDLNNRTCTCRYWMLSGLPCLHAIILCINYTTNNLDNYVADCYRIDEFKRIYAHCLEPCEGMTSWPVSDWPRLLAPGYVKLPGRPKKERTREGHEKPKATKISRVGTVGRCRICKLSALSSLKNRVEHQRKFALQVQLFCLSCSLI